MAKKGVETITIKFKPEGDKKLINAFKGIANAQGKLNNKTEETVRKFKKINPTVTTLTAKLKAQGLSWKKLGVDTHTVSQAYKGNRVAIEKLKTSYEKMNTTTRILGGSFAVLRSKMLIGAFAVGIISQTIGKAMKAFEDFDRAMLQVRTTISTTGATAGITSHQIKNLAKELQETANISDTVTAKASAMMLTFTKISGDVFIRAIKSASDLSIAFDQDMKSSVIQLGKALNSPKEGLTALRRIGISFSEEQKKLINNFLEMNDLASAQAVILDELEVEFGKVSTAMAKTDVGAWTSAWNTWVDVGKNTGEAFATITKPLAILTNWIGKGLVKFKDWSDEVKGATDANEKLTSNNEFLTASTKGFLRVFRSLSPEIQQQLKDIGITELGFRDMRLEARKSDEGFEKYQKTVEDWNKKIQTTISLMAINSEEVEKHGLKMEDLIPLWANKDKDEFNKALEKQIQKWYENEQALFAYGERLMAVQPKMNKIQKSFLGFDSIDAERLKKRASIIEQGGKLFADGKMTELEVIKWVKEQEELLDAETLQKKTKHYSDIAKVALQSFNGMTSALSNNVNTRMNMELESLRNSERFKRASDDKKKAMEKDVTKKYASERTRLARFEKASNFAQAGINIATAITKVLPNVLLASLIGAMGAVQLGAIASTPIPKFSRGGFVGGRRHSQGGTMIEAERGEFVMSRQAVQAIGIENMNKINQGQGASPVNISFNGNVMSQDFIEDEAIPMIKEAIRRGADIGVS